MNKTLKKGLRIALLVLLSILILLVGYLIYFVGSFNRIGNMAIMPENGSQTVKVSKGKQYNLLSWNVGFGAYDSEYSFFMDGGKSSRARSEQAVYQNLNGVIDSVNDYANNVIRKDLDFICFQEVDFDSTRSYKVNQKKHLQEGITGYWSSYVQNYNSPYILYPFFSPHGANKSGMLTMSKNPISSTKRIELPIESGLYKFFDLDRCLSLNRIPLTDGKDLVLINVHLSAYTSDGKIADEQLKVLVDLCKIEVNKGNYVVCAGDFNKDLLGNSDEVFGVNGDEYTWAQPLKTEYLEGSGMSLVAPVGKEFPVASCRTANIPYKKGTTYELTVDGFLVSSNVTVVSGIVLDCEYEYSDHNPVVLSFKLN